MFSFLNFEINTAQFLVYIRGSGGFVLLTAVGEEAVLTALARENARLGMIFLEMRRAAQDLVKLVG